MPFTRSLSLCLVVNPTIHSNVPDLGKRYAQVAAAQQEEMDDTPMDSGEAYPAEEEEEAHPGFESCIASVTADFAMQNVILQMGLRLVTPDGRRIREMHCWVLRCSACLTTSREVRCTSP